METTMIADAVEETRGALEWTDEAYALGGEVDCGWDDDDMRGWLHMGPVSVEWLRDPYGDGQEDWVAVNVSVAGEPFDADGYPHLEDAVKGAVHTTAEWQHYCDGEIKDAVVEWLDDRPEAYYLDGPQDELDSWTVTWRDVSIQGYYDDDGKFVWSVSNGETGDHLDGSASSTPADVLAAIEQITADPMEETWIETIDDCLPEDEADVHAMAREAHERVKAVSE